MFAEFPGCSVQWDKSVIPEGVPSLISWSVLGDAILAEVGICSFNPQPITIQMSARSLPTSCIILQRPCIVC